MSFAGQAPQVTTYTSTPPQPPPRPMDASGLLLENRGPPPPPPPPPPFRTSQGAPSELDAGPNSRPDASQATSRIPFVPSIEDDWLPSNVKDKSIQDLQHLLSDSNLQTALLANPSTTHSAVLESQAAMQPMIESNIALASSLLELEAEVSSLREQTQTRLLALRALEQQHRSKISETEAAVDDFSPQGLYQRLNASVQEQDQLVRGMEQSWLEEDGVATDKEVGDFLRRLKDAHKVAFLRRERKARWDEGRVGGWR